MVFLLGIFFTSMLCFAKTGPSELMGAGSSGGGDVVSCGWWNKQYSLADTYELKFSGYFSAFEDLSSNEFYNAIIKSLNEEKEGLGDLINNTVNTLFGRDLENVIWVDKLEELDDDFIKINERYKSKCKYFAKKQLAVQNIDKKELRVVEKYFNKLSLEEKEIFKIHEALIYLAKAPSNTTPIRSFVKDIIRNKRLTNVIAGINKNEMTKSEKILEIAWAIHKVIVFGLPRKFSLGKNKECYIKKTGLNDFLNHAYLTFDEFKNKHPYLYKNLPAFFKPVSPCLNKYFRLVKTGDMHDRTTIDDLYKEFLSFFPYEIKTNPIDGKIFLMAWSQKNSLMAAIHLYENLEINFYKAYDPAYVPNATLDNELEIEAIEYVEEVLNNN